jgi:hypothetical protein
MMLGIAAAVVFAIAFVIDATRTATDAVFSPGTLLFLGLCLLALHLSGFGAKWSTSRRR